MLLIDIINELEFGGADFLLAVEAAKKRRRFLAPVLRKVLEYAATHPGAYLYRFSDCLLCSSAFLLAELEDPQFLRLAAPLIDTDRGEPDLLGYGAYDDAKLIAMGAGARVERVVEAICADPPPHGEFIEAALDALMLRAQWSPDLRGKVVLALRSLLGPGRLVLMDWNIRQSLVEHCCQLDPDEFILALQIAVQRNELDEGKVAIAAATRGSAEAPPPEWSREGRLDPTDMFMAEYWATFEELELEPATPKRTKQRTSVDSGALRVFNRLCYPSRDLRRRLADACPPNPALIDVATRVVALAAASPDDYRCRRRGHAVAMAICLGSPAGDRAFTAAFLKLLQQPLDDVERLVGSDVTELGDDALAASTRNDPWAIKALIEDPEADGSVRGVALAALGHHIDMGTLSREDVACYCRDLVGRGEAFGNEWFWSDLADLSARAGARDLMPVFQAMFREGGGRDDYRDEQDIAQEFSSPKRWKHRLHGVDALALFDRSELHKDHRRAFEFIQRFEPPGAGTQPDYAEMEDEPVA